jgi:hypothetical protein
MTSQLLILCSRKRSNCYVTDRVELVSTGVLCWVTGRMKYPDEASVAKRQAAWECIGRCILINITPNMQQ